jgi:hypothetical protein
LIPVCNGTETDFLVITPGATFSTGYSVFEESSPLASIASQRAFTTLPRYCSPTHTENILPVHVTTCH